jgi:hypothetical protein
MTLKPDTILASLPAFLAQDAALAAWAMAHYGRVHKVFNNVNVLDLPAAGDCPYLAVAVPGYRAGRELEAVDVVVVVECGLHDEAAQVTGIANLVEFRGVDRLEAFRQLALAGLVACLGGSFDVVEVAAELDTYTQFPFLTCQMEVTVREYLTLDGDPLA